MHVPAEQCPVGHDDVVAEFAVVSDMATGHQEITVPDFGDAIFLLAAAIDRDAFANDIAIADEDSCVAAGIADVLRFAADDDGGVDHIIMANRDVAHHGDGIEKPCAALNANIRSDDAERPDFDVDIDFGARVNRCGRCNLDCHDEVLQLSTAVAVMEGFIEPVADLVL
jgi:hypothetical protein